MTEAVVTHVHRKLKLSNRLSLQLAQVRLVTTCWVASVCLGSDSTQQYNFFQLRVLGLHQSQGGWRALDQFISFSKCCRRPGKCIERLQELYISATAYNWGFLAGCVARPKSKCH